MSRSKIDTAFIGHYSLAVLDEAKPKDAGWLVKALAAWILRDELPDESKIPSSVKPLWRIIRDESETIHAARQTDINNGKKGGRPPKKPQETQNNPNVENGNPIETKMEMESKNILPDDRRRARARESDIGVGHRSSVDSSIRIPSPSEDFVVWAKLQEDPVDVAMCATGETDKRARRTYGAQLKRLGRERFVDLVCDFHSTLAEEPPRNRGATLTAFLRDTP